MKILHVTINTNKFEEEIAFYKEIIGLKVIRDMRTFGTPIVFLADEEGDTEIEVINEPEGNDAGNEYLFIGFKCEDVDAKREELTAKGYETSDMVAPNPQVRFFFIKDPAGVKIQFI